MKIDEASLDQNVTGAELIPVSDGGAAKAVSVAQVKDFTLASLVGAGGADAATVADGVFLVQSTAGGEVLRRVTAQQFAQMVWDYAFGQNGAAALNGNEKFAIKNGNLRQTVTLEAVKTWLEGNMSVDVDIDLDALDAAQSFDGGDLALVAQSGDAKKATLAALRAFMLAGLREAATAQTAALTNVDEILAFVGSGTSWTLKRLTVAQSGLGRGTVTRSGTQVIGAVPVWTSGANALSGGVVIKDTLDAQGGDTLYLVSQNAVIAMRDALQTAIDAKADGANFLPKTGGTLTGPVVLKGTVVPVVIFQTNEGVVRQTLKDGGVTLRREGIDYYLAYPVKSGTFATTADATAAGTAAVTAGLAAGGAIARAIADAIAHSGGGGADADAIAALIDPDSETFDSTNALYVAVQHIIRDYLRTL